MYNPDQHREERPEVLQAFIARHPFGALVAHTPDGLTANHIPMTWRARSGTPGVLHGHIARANHLWELVPPDAPVLVIFSGANHYLTPSWYPDKRAHGKVVPTWNYSVVHAHGTIRFTDERDVRLARVSELTKRQEAAREAPWHVSDAPADYLESMLKRITAFEIGLTGLVGKFKSSQHRSSAERDSVTAALVDEGVPEADIAELVRPPAPSGS
ncbi:MAG TPA: FMN-binding negative transcriptional regulator [Steroidobacteraceae bacterium]|nr:FMN-binding negative transcriptional regulator [Steroidobacteraceae bacterium]